MHDKLLPAVENAQPIKGSDPVYPNIVELKVLDANSKLHANQVWCQLE